MEYYEMINNKLMRAKVMGLKPIVAMKYDVAKKLERECRVGLSEEIEPAESIGLVREYVGITTVINNNMDEDVKVYVEFE